MIYHLMNQGRLFVHLLLVTLSALVLTGCAVMQPIHSTPPVSKIVLSQPFDSDGFGFHLHMPAGEYQPVYEEGYVYYYQAPSPISTRAIITEDFVGGFYVDVRAKSQVGWWHFQDDGDHTVGRIDGNVPGLRMIP